MAKNDQMPGSNLPDDNKSLTKEQLIELVSQKENELLKAQQQIVKSEHKAVALSDKLKLMETYPSLAEKKAEMEYYLEMAKQFSASKAFNKDYTPEQIFVIMKAGKEMGMQEVEALQSLYIVNGQVDFFGDKMIARITKAGYKIEYLNEIEEAAKAEVTVKVTSSDGKWTAQEKATAKDQIIMKSKAAQFALKNKLRFHAIRMIVSFHLPHLFGSVADQFSKEFHDWEDVTQAPKAIAQGDQMVMSTRENSNTETLVMQSEANPEWATEKNG